MITNPLLHRTRRHFFKDCGIGLGKIALASMLAKESFGAMGNPGFMRFPVKANSTPRAETRQSPSASIQI